VKQAFFGLCKSR